MDNDTSFLNKKYSLEDLKIGDTSAERLREYFEAKHPSDFQNKRDKEVLNIFDLWVKKNKAGYHYTDVHNSIIEYLKTL